MTAGSEIAARSAVSAAPPSPLFWECLCPDIQSEGWPQSKQGLGEPLDGMLERTGNSSSHKVTVVGRGAGEGTGTP